jgi:DNA-binding GntR family transcriptional regulator
MMEAVVDGVERAERLFTPVQHRSLPEIVLIELRRAIINGKLTPGERLVEAELAEQMSVSRATVRQALHQLQFEGLVEVRPRRGAVVTRMSAEDAMEVCEVRGLLEGYAARTACQVLTPEQRQHLLDIAEDMGHAIREGDIFRLVQLDIAFHTIICQTSPNRRLYILWAALNAQHGALMSSRIAYHHPEWETIVELHRDLCRALATGDPDQAEAAVRFHYGGLQLKNSGER